MAESVNVCITLSLLVFNHNHYINYEYHLWIIVISHY